MNDYFFAVCTTIQNIKKDTYKWKLQKRSKNQYIPIIDFKAIYCNNIFNL